MADLSIIARRAAPGSTKERNLRLNRRRNRGLMVDTRTGFSSRNRRVFIRRTIAITASTNPLRTAYVRRRLRRGWSLQDAISTAVGQG